MLMMNNSITKPTNTKSSGIETESVEKLLSHIANQIKNINNKLTFVIDRHVAEDLQNYYNKVNQTLSILVQKTI